MRALVLGDEDDARGFALAGVEARACRNASELLAALERATSDADVGLIVVAAAVAALDPPAIGRARARAGSALLLVLPFPVAAEPAAGEAA
jgi:vacuolar-type H+-ATPase subunit F/Vma7